MSDTNPNVPVMEAGEPEVSSGEGPLSFDDLDSALSTKSGKSSSKQAKESAAKESKSEKTVEAPDAKEDKETKSKKAGEKEADKKVEEPQRKTFKAKHQDKELDLDEEATFTVRVNGQDVEVPAKELFSNYSGKVAYDKKFSEIAKKEMQFRKESDGLNKNKNLIKEIFSEKDPSMRMFKMAELAGVSPVDFRKAYFDENIKVLEQYSQMSDDEKKAADLQFENSYLRHQSETRDRDLSSQQAQADLDRKVNEVLATHAIEKGEFVDYYDKVAALAKPDGTLELIRQGRTVNEPITPELISELILKDRMWQSAEAKFGTLKLDWKPEVLNKQMMDLVENAYSHGIKSTDLPDVIDELFGSKKSQRVVSEKVKAKEEFKQSKAVNSPRSESEEPWSFDQM